MVMQTNKALPSTLGTLATNGLILITMVIGILRTRPQPGALIHLFWREVRSTYMTRDQRQLNDYVIGSLLVVDCDCRPNSPVGESKQLALRVDWARLADAFRSS